MGFLAVVSIRLLPLDDSLTNLTASLQGRQKSSLTWICDMHSHRYDTLRFHRKNSKLPVHRVFVRFRFLSFFLVKSISRKKKSNSLQGLQKSSLTWICDMHSHRYDQVYLVSRHVPDRTQRWRWRSCFAKMLYQILGNK